MAGSRRPEPLRKPIERQPLPPAKPMVSVFMPARNEEETIERNLAVLREAHSSGQVNHSVIVIDGPTDSTREKILDALQLARQDREKLSGPIRATVALPNGFILINHPDSLGKGRSFMEAVMTLKGRTSHFSNPDSVLVNLDSDAIDLTSEHIVGIAQELRRQGHPMVLGVHKEEIGTERRHFVMASPDSTGYRAISAGTLFPLLNFDERWVRLLDRNLNLDHTLNILIPLPAGFRRFNVAPFTLHHLRPFRNLGIDGQQRESRRVSERVDSVRFADPNDVAFKEKLGRLNSSRKK